MNIRKINRIDIVNNAYVSPLKTLHSPPLELYYKGTLPVERRPTIAIIGTRKPSPYGKEVTRTFAAALARHGVIIVSGLALGTDSIAHQAALEARGTTIAILANGLHRVYPASHTPLARRIVEQGGALISEKETGYEARPYDFLARNRLIAGIADAILVIEATEKSGTLSTVQHAVDQGKDIFVVPGPITSALSAGSNRALQQYGYAALKPEDILERIAPQLLTKRRQAQLPLGDTPLEAQILQLIKEGVQEGSELAEKCSAPVAEYLQAMTMLELKGAIYALGADRWELKLL